MPKVIVNSKSGGNTPLVLRNGGLLLYKEKVFMIVSSPNSNAKYCSLICLTTGNRVCAEPVSRNTCKSRVLSHLRNYNCYTPEELNYISPKSYSMFINIGDADEDEEEDKSDENE